jgi:hypothetical protein
MTIGDNYPPLKKQNSSEIAGFQSFLKWFTRKGNLAVCGAFALHGSNQSHRQRTAGFGRGIYHVLCCPLLVLESADVISEQPDLDRLQYFPLLGAGASDVAAGLIRYSGLATGSEYGSNGIIDNRGAVIVRQTAEDLPADVWQTPEYQGDRQKPGEKLAAQKTTSIK